jgi:L-fuconolactonase
VRRIERVCAEHGVRLIEAALQFVMGHPAVRSVIPGAVTASEVETNVALFSRPAARRPVVRPEERGPVAPRRADAGRSLMAGVSEPVTAFAETSPERRIDAHQHFWRPSRGDYGWLTPALAAIHRDFLPDDLAPLLSRHGIAGTVLVQAAPTEQETRFLLSLAAEHAFVEGVVGWADFAAPDAPARIAALASHAKLKGLRPMIQDIADDDWMLRPDLEAAFAALVERGLVFDALVLPRHLENLVALLRRHPELGAVVDHCAKPDIGAVGFRDWADAMTAIAGESAAFCKLSGLVTQTRGAWSVEALRPTVEHVLGVFGPQRLIWGSDWPVCTLAAGYDAWVEATDVLLQGCTAAERDAVLGGNAVRAYRL